MLFEGHAVADLARDREGGKQLYCVEVLGRFGRPGSRKLGGALEAGGRGVDEREHVGEIFVGAAMHLFARRRQSKHGAVLEVDNAKLRHLAMPDEGREFHGLLSEALPWPVKRQRHALKRRINQQGISRGNSGSSAPPSSGFAPAWRVCFCGITIAPAPRRSAISAVFSQGRLSPPRGVGSSRSKRPAPPGRARTRPRRIISNVFVEALFGGHRRGGRAAAEAGGARRFGLAGHDCGGQGIAERVWAVARARFRLA